MDFNKWVTIIGRAILLTIVLGFFIFSVFKIGTAEVTDFQFIRSTYRNISSLSKEDDVDAAKVRSWYENYLSLLSVYPRWRTITTVSFIISFFSTLTCFILYRYGSHAIIEMLFINFIITFIILYFYLQYNSWHTIRPNFSDVFKDELPPGVSTW